MTCRTYRRCYGRLVLPIALAASAMLQPINAKFVTVDIVDVPVERLTRNLERRASQNPMDAEVRFDLARLHAMAYALKTETAPARKGREDEGAWFGYTPASVPFTAKATDDGEKLKSAREHLQKAIARYEEVIKLEPGHLAAALGHAWCVEQTGDRESAIREYRRITNSAWQKEKDLKHAPLGWRSLTAEAAGYLIPLLDANLDKAEIAELRRRIDQSNSIPRPVTPIVVPLREGIDGRELEDRWASVAFDADGTGLKKRWTWINKDAGWLVFDARATGKVSSALQMFGGVTFWLFWDNGYEALAALDDDGDGELSGPELAGLAIWRDLNVNGISEAGEVKPLAAWGIVGVSCQCAQTGCGSNGILYSPEGVIFRDGTRRPSYDIVLRPALKAVD